PIGKVKDGRKRFRGPGAGGNERHQNQCCMGREEKTRETPSGQCDEQTAPQAPARRGGSTYGTGDVTALLAPEQEKESDQSESRQRERRDNRHFGVAVQSREDDLRRHDAESSAEEIRRRERGQRGHEGQDRRSRESGTKQRKSHANECPRLPRAERRR